ncbi:MAG: hypothetical protein KC731_30975, partial [Myxococcales bacterium]|nr:hypothetical protein [Myxococcales bacterium]
DLKPANLFVLADGALKVLDFGIARQGHRQADEVAIEAFDPAGEMSTAAFLVEHQSQEGDRPRGATSRFAVGTPGFMAPEIIEGGEATPASDAYALAALMVQLTTGSLPQVTSTQLDGTANTTQAWFAEVQAATLRGQLRDLSGLEVGLPRALVALLERWLSLDPVQRRLEAGGMGEALDAVWHCPQGVEPNPFKGLRPYGPEDEGRLPGRGPEIGRLSRELLDVPAVVLQADPGSGMRSLALAGVVPGLAKSFADGRDDWQPIVVSFAVKPKRSPDARVREAIAAHLEAKGREGDDLDALARACEEERLGAVMVLDDVDLALSHPPDERGLLGRLFHDDPEVTPGLRCVGTAGTDTTQTLIEDAALGEGLRPWLRFIGPVQAGLAGELILEPATAAGREVRRLEPVIEALRAELGQDGSRLPVLSVALQRFWEQSSGPLDGAAWEKHGGLLGYFSEHADEVIKGVEPELRDAIDAILLRLVPLDEERIEVERGDLLAVAGERGARALAALADARLLLRRGDAFRLAHPALGERWARLADLRLANLERLTFLQELRAAAQRWSAAAMARDLVWPAHRLREIDRYDDLERDLSEDERRFVQASRAAGRLAWGLRVMAVAFVLLVVAGAAWAQHTIEARALEQSIAVARERDRAAVGRMVTRSRRTED